MFTAKIEIPNKKPRYIPNCIIYRGKVVQVIKKGVGKSWEAGGFGVGGDGETWTEYEKYEDASEC